MTAGSSMRKWLRARLAETPAAPTISGAVLLRLRLGDRLAFESRSGNKQSADLFYRLEHGQA